MKKYLIGMVASACIILLVMYCYKENHQVRIPRYCEVKMITWEKLDTFVMENPTFKVEYPDNFVPDSSLLNNRNMRFDYSFAGCDSPGLSEEKVKNLKALVHDWNPK